MPSIALGMCFLILCIHKFCFPFWFDLIVLIFIGVFVSYILLTMQMSSLPLTYVGYADGASCQTQHITSATWVIYTPKAELFCSRGVFLGTATNNIAEYVSIISLLTKASSRDISNPMVRLDSYLVVMQLTNRYHIRNPTLLLHYLRVRLLER